MRNPPTKRERKFLALLLPALLLACNAPVKPAPASLLIKVLGAKGATVEVTAAQNGKRVFLGTVVGEAELAGLEPGPYRIDGKAENGVDPDPVETKIAPGARAVVALDYRAPVAQAVLTVRLLGVERASVVLSREGQAIFSGEIAKSRAFTLEPGRYTVDGQPSGAADPPAVDVELKGGETKTVDLDYTAPPPPPAPGVRILAPAAGSTLTQPLLHVEVEIQDPGLYRALHVAFLAKGVLKVWSVQPGQTRYQADLVLDPDSYNGQRTLVARVQKTGEAQWTEAASEPLTVAIPWKGSAYVEFQGLPAEVALEPGQSRRFSFLARSRNGFEGKARFTADPLDGVQVTVSPSQSTFAVGEEKTLTLTVTADPGAASGVRQGTVRWQDAWGLRSGYRSFPVKASKKPVPAFTAPASPWHARPVPIAATVQDDGVMKEVRFYLDGKLLSRDDAAPFETQWTPGLVENGPHRLRAEAEDSLGFVGTAELSFDLAVPLGVRREIGLPASPSAAPVAWNGAVFLPAGNRVLRLQSPDAKSVDSLDLGAPVRKLLVWNNRLFAATETGVYEIAGDFATAPLRWGGQSDFRDLVAGSEPIAVYGNRLRGLESGSEAQLPEPPTAVAATASLVFLGYPSGRIERRILGSSLAPEVRTAKEAIVDLAVYGGALWQSAPNRVWRYPLTFNRLKSPDAFAAADWAREGVIVETDVAPDPEGEPRADRVTRDAAAAPFRLTQTVQLEEGSYAFGVHAKGDPATALTLRAVRTDDGQVLGSRGPVTLADGDPWTYLEAPFSVPPGGAKVRVEIALEAGAGPALLSQARLWLAPSPAFSTCGTPHPFQPGGLFTDAGGCLFRLGTGKLLQTRADLLAGVAEAGGVFYLAGAAGDLEAWRGSARKAAEKPVAAAPVGGILARGYLYLPYADGKLRILDPLP